MNNLAIMEVPDELTMSSREIADLTGKRHADVRRDIRSMLSELKIGVSRFAHTYLDSQNKEQEEYRLPKNLTMTLVTGYRADLRLRVVDRMMELEQQKAIDFSNPDHLLPLLNQYVADNKKKADEIAAMRPKVAGYERIARADGSLCIQATAKTLNTRPKDLFQWMHSNNWIYRRNGGGSWLGYQDKIKQGLLEHKVTEVTRSDGSRKITEQCRVTPKGLAKLAELKAAENFG